MSLVNLEVTLIPIYIYLGISAFILTMLVVIRIACGDRVTLRPVLEDKYRPSQETFQLVSKTN